MEFCEDNSDMLMEMNMKLENEMKLDDLDAVVGGMGNVYTRVAGGDDPGQIGHRQYVCPKCKYIGTYQAKKPVRCPKCDSLLNGNSMA